MPRLSRSLGLLDAVFLGVGFIVGSGIYLFPVRMATIAGTYSLISWSIGGVYAALTGLCFAENSVRVPKAGGLYSFAHAALGNLPGFMTGWSFWMGYVITIATETRAIAVYSVYFLPGDQTLTLRLVIAFAMAILFTLVNYLGVKQGGVAEDILTIGKLLPLFIFVAVGLFFLNQQNYHPLMPQSASISPAIGSATILALWAYLGVEIITVPEEEIRDEKRTVPKAIVVSVVAVVATYLAVSAVALGVARWDQYQNSATPLADIFQSKVGNTGGVLLAIGGLVSIIGSLNAVILGTARISYAMARDKLFPKVFAKLNPKHKIPDRGMLLQTAIAFGLVFFITDLSSLASLAVLFTIIPYLLSTVATVKLLKADGWKTKVTKTRLVPFASVLTYIILIAYVSPTILLIGSGLLLVGFIVYALRRSFGGPTRIQRKQSRQYCGRVSPPEVR